MSAKQLTSRVESPPRRRLLALVKAETFAPYVQRQGQAYRLDAGDELWLRQNVNCQAACPVHTDAPRYIALIAGGDYDAAFAVNRQANVFPDILGRVCHRPCEAACRRGLLDEPVAICDLKRFAADHKSRVAERSSPLEKSSDKRVAVVGSGPAGLAAALDLAGWDHAVTVYEAQARPGGMLAVGVPPYRLPRRFIEAAVQEVQAAGVEFRLGARVGQDVSLSRLTDDYDAVLLAVGAHASLGLNVPGEKAEGVLRGLPLMYAINRQSSGLPLIEGQRVLVVGGGHTAIDCARSSLRLGGAVTLVYRRSRAEMPAIGAEVEAAEKEGVQFQFLAAPVQVLEQEGRVVGLECVRTELGEVDESGRRRAAPLPGSEFRLDADVVIVAVGQRPALGSLLDGEGLKTDWGAVIADPGTQATGLPGVFAAGDCVTGPLNVLDALAAGRRAAVAMDCYLRGDEGPVPPAFPADLPSDVPERQLAGDDGETIPRQVMPSLPLEERLDLQREAELGFSEEQARLEAQRCYQCDWNVFVEAERCTLCNKCVEVCPQKCLEIIALERVEHGDELPGMETAREWLDGGALLIDEAPCTRCYKCVQVCPPQCMAMRRYAENGWSV